MKKLLYILLLIPLFIACGDDDEEKRTDIVGSWYPTMSKIRYEYIETFFENGRRCYNYKDKPSVQQADESATYKLKGDTIQIYIENRYIQYFLYQLDKETDKLYLFKPLTNESPSGVSDYVEYYRMSQNDIDRLGVKF